MLPKNFANLFWSNCIHRYFCFVLINNSPSPFRSTLPFNRCQIVFFFLQAQNLFIYSLWHPHIFVCHSNDWSFRCINFWWIQIVILDEGIWQIRSSASIGWIAHTFLFPSVSPHRLYNRITTLPPAAKNASCTHWIKLTNKEHQEPPSLKYSLHHAFSLEWCDFGFWCQSNQPSQFPLFT